MTSIRRPDGGDHTAPEDTATKWPPCVGMGGRDASESVAAIIGMRTPLAALAQSPELKSAVRQYEALEAQGKYAEAEPFARKAVELGEAEFGPDHSTYATYLNNL
ncbi:MAG: tetratricopeptide repeat protein, partial [Alphaproteobacteria bacterium]|nr:tetratricopeptide repeat protein [Alphaproteobacteria bacterium]